MNKHMYLSRLSLVALITLSVTTPLIASPALEPWTYSENFESCEPGAWASYPLWQDTAYDDNFNAGTMIPGDPNISIVQYVTPYSHVDRYAGAQKKLDMVLIPSSRITARFYIKSHLPAEFIKLRIAAGKEGAFDYTIPSPAANEWTWIDVRYADILAENPSLSGMPNIPITGMAFLVKIPAADPDMPFYFGIDDITVEGARRAEFAFAEPEMCKLPEWKQYITKRHFKPGETFPLSGTWCEGAERVSMSVASFVRPDSTIKKLDLTKKENLWQTSFPLPRKQGLYLAKLTAFAGMDAIAETEFTFFVAPQVSGNEHPRLWFDSDGRKRIAGELKNDANKRIADEIMSQAKKHRADYPVNRMVYDFDQFPKENWLVTRYSWSLDRIRTVGDAAYWNALAYSLLGDSDAGEYAKSVLLTYAQFPTWNHPWMIERGRHFYLLIGDMAMYFAVAYDLTHEIMNNNERALVRDAFMNNVVRGVHRTYVEDNLVTNNTSNWIAAILGGSICCQSAIYGESPETSAVEPYFTGAVFKMNALIEHAIGDDGGYGEGYGYYSYSSRSWSKSLPALENVFGVDLSARLNGVYDELVWAGLIKDKLFFHNGDSRGNLLPMEAWAWLLPKYRDPLLGWLYYWTNSKETKTISGFDTFSKSGIPLFTIMQGKTLMDIIYQTDDAPVNAPFDRNPVRLFRDIGTTVFKSGWNSDDFVFTMRTGPFYNHQHLDQGSFWLADRGAVFIGEHEGSSYYDDPHYESYYTQPIAHSTIIVDGNRQSQRTGDPKSFIEGFDDHAFIYHFLDGESASFVSGDIGRLYWGAVKDMKRNVLYIKPRTLIMMDTVVPAERNADITELFQTRYLDDISAGNDISSIGGDTSLNIRHLWPDDRIVKAEEMPHFLSDYKEKPLKRRGYLSVSARTRGVPLVIANILSTEESVKNIPLEYSANCIRGEVSGMKFAVSKDPLKHYSAGNYSTDALALAWNDDSVIAALVTSLSGNDGFMLTSCEPITVELTAKGMKYSLAKPSAATLAIPSQKKTITINGVKTPVDYSNGGNGISIQLPGGEGAIEW